MLRSILISPDEALNGELAAALAEVGTVEVLHTFPTYPKPDELLRSVRVHKPNVLFLGVKELSHVEALVARLDEVRPGFPVIAVGAGLEPDVMRALMHLGVREYLTVPINHAQLVEVIGSIERHLKQHPPPVVRIADVYTFLPAKPGAGTSTIAVSASCALANDLAVHTLLLDCDLDAGSIKFLLKLGNTASLMDAVQHANKLDDDLLSQMVGKWEKLDVLHAGELAPPPSVDLPGLQRVLTIFRTRYEVICADLASSLNPFSMTLMRESRLIFMVTTPEVIPLHFARERVRSLGELGLKDRVRLLLNRKPGSHTSLDDAQAAELVGIPVAYSFPENCASVQASILSAGPVSRDSDLGESILALARSLTASHPAPQGPSKGRKFLDFFHGQHHPQEVPHH